MRRRPGSSSASYHVCTSHVPSGRSRDVFWRKVSVWYQRPTYRSCIAATRASPFAYVTARAGAGVGGAMGARAQAPAATMMRARAAARAAWAGARRMPKASLEARAAQPAALRHGARGGEGVVHEGDELRQGERLEQLRM